jgi:hypothetical protein
VNLALILNLPMNFSQEKAVQNFDDLFYVLIGKSGQIFAFSQRFLTVKYLEEYQIFPMAKVVDILNLAMNFSDCRRHGKL